MQQPTLQQQLGEIRRQYRRLLEQALKDSEPKLLGLLQQHQGQVTINLHLEAGPATEKTN